MRGSARRLLSCRRHGNAWWARRHPDESRTSSTPDTRVRSREAPDDRRKGDRIMRTFAQTPKETQQTTSATSMTPGRVHFGNNCAVNTILHLQSTIGNQAVQRVLQTTAGGL